SGAACVDESPRGIVVLRSVRRIFEAAQKCGRRGIGGDLERCHFQQNAGSPGVVVEWRSRAIGMADDLNLHVTRSKAATSSRRSSVESAVGTRLAPRSPGAAHDLFMSSFPCLGEPVSAPARAV